MKVAWFLACAGALAVLAGFLWARRTAKRIERLAQSYWELRYEHGQLQARVARLEPPASGADQEPAASPGRPTSNFVPLSSLRK